MHGGARASSGRDSMWCFACQAQHTQGRTHARLPLPVQRKQQPTPGPPTCACVRALRHTRISSTRPTKSWEPYSSSQSSCVSPAEPAARAEEKAEGSTRGFGGQRCCAEEGPATRQQPLAAVRCLLPCRAALWRGRLSGPISPAHLAPSQSSRPRSPALGPPPACRPGGCACPCPAPPTRPVGRGKEGTFRVAEARILIPECWAQSPPKAASPVLIVTGSSTGP